ncbi:MAG: hypothetical protein KIT10_03370 [Flavobacteriales bacterium]|nr:hypothetical protein [Flavobacteriales bacterium]
MTAPPLKDRLVAIQEQVTRLVREHGEAQRKAAELEAEVLEHRRMCDVLKARVAELERENEGLRKARVASSRPADTGTKEKIDELVNEIDRCLALIQA